MASDKCESPGVCSPLAEHWQRINSLHSVHACRRPIDGWHGLLCEAHCQSRFTNLCGYSNLESLQANDSAKLVQSATASVVRRAKLADLWQFATRITLHNSSFQKRIPHMKSPHTSAYIAHILLHSNRSIWSIWIENVRRVSQFPAAPQIYSGAEPKKKANWPKIPPCRTILSLSDQPAFW